MALTDLIRDAELENESNTPAFMLAAYLLACLDVYGETTMRRDQWRGNSTLPVAGSKST